MEACLMGLTAGDQWLLELGHLGLEAHIRHHASHLRKLAEIGGHREILVQTWNSQVGNLRGGAESRQKLIEVLAAEKVAQIRSAHRLHFRVQTRI